ncbi:MAG: hypothetical protein QOG72_2436 [Sphingomonadales bacterium]|jgi:hypothetical protein|nr:hypothetical protein [Sphingomonadales bacterium]
MIARHRAFWLSCLGTRPTPVERLGRAAQTYVRAIRAFRKMIRNGLHYGWMQRGNDAG